MMRNHNHTVWLNRLTARKHAPQIAYNASLWDRGSLTKQLRGMAKQSFSVHIKAQYWAKSCADACAVLNVPQREWVLHRLVSLRCDKVPCVLGYTQIPRSTLPVLGKLGSRPLGDLLFRHPSMKRATIEIARLRRDQPLWHTVMYKQCIAEHTLWARRSIFIVHAKQLLVTDIFLPGYWDLMA